MVHHLVMRTINKDFFEKYESVTKEEYKTELKEDIPTYILIDKSVYSEYQTFKQNRENKTINYAHVDSINIFHLIDEILSQPKNNAMYQFEKDSEIKEWLREQWAGLFRELLNNKNKNEQYNSLNERVEKLSSINTSMKNYLESIISTSDNGNAEEKDVLTIYENSTSVKKFLQEAFRISSLSKHRKLEELTQKWEEEPDFIKSVNKVRTLLKKEPWDFE